MISRLLAASLWIALPLSIGLASTDVPQDLKPVAFTQTSAHQDDPVTLAKEGPEEVVSPPNPNDTLQTEEVPSNINKDTGIFLYGDPKSKKSATGK